MSQNRSLTDYEFVIGRGGRIGLHIPKSDLGGIVEAVIISPIDMFILVSGQVRRAEPYGPEIAIPVMTALALARDIADQDPQLISEWTGNMLIVEVDDHDVIGSYFAPVNLESLTSGAMIGELS